jgi:hypothetical protein
MSLLNVKGESFNFHNAGEMEATTEKRNDRAINKKD